MGTISLNQMKDIFKRDNINTTKEIVQWWGLGRGLLNTSLIAYTLLHLAVIVLVFKNGWIVFLLPIIASIFLGVNIAFSLGLFVELFCSKVLNMNIDFNKVSPVIKRVQLVIIALIVLSLSLFDILNQ